MKHKVKVVKREDFLLKYSGMVYPLLESTVVRVGVSNESDWRLTKVKTSVKSLVPIGGNQYLCYAKHDECFLSELQQCLIASRSQIVHNVNLELSVVSFYNPERGDRIYDWDTVESFDIIEVI